jgi:hypothetical protein
MLIVEAEANGVLWSTNERVLPSLVQKARRVGTKDFYPVLAALVSPVQNIFSSRYTINLYVPIAEQRGQTVVQGRLSLNVCLRSHPNTLPSPPPSLPLSIS